MTSNQDFKHEDAQVDTSRRVVRVVSSGYYYNTVNDGATLPDGHIEVSIEPDELSAQCLCFNNNNSRISREEKVGNYFSRGKVIVEHEPLASIPLVTALRGEFNNKISE